MDQDDVLMNNDEVDGADSNTESWLAEQVRLISLEDGLA
jgi:hypothetical protein